MENYKVRVNNEDESKESQVLFFDLGASLGNGDKHAVLVPNIMGLAVIDGLINFVFNDVVFADIEQCEELTLPKLRDLVVLKRNSKVSQVECEYKEISQEYKHYKKDVSNLNSIDVYRVLKIFDVKDPALQHAVKKILCAGDRGTKDKVQDIQEAIASLNRFLEMIKEDDDIPF